MVAAALGLLVALGLAPTAAASSFITAVSDPVPLPVGGLWARAAPADTGWDFFWAAGGGLRHGVLGDDLTLDERASTEITGHTDLADHHITRCPDGTWVHVASAAVNAPNDTAWGFRYDAAFTRTVEAVVVPTTTEVRTNDMAMVCTTAVQAVGFSGLEGADLVYGLDAALAPTLLVDSQALPQLMGGSLVWEDEGDTLFAVGRAYGRPLTGQSFTLDGTPVGDAVELPLAESGEDAYWPQGLLRVGDHWLLAYMWRVDDGSFTQDTGNVRLAVLDLDWNVEEVLPLTDYAAPNGAMRPWIARKGDQALVSFDVDQVPTVVPLTLDLTALGYTDAGPGDTGDTGDTGKDGGCGCTSGAGVSPGLAGVLAALVIRRRRRLGA